MHPPGCCSQTSNLLERDCDPGKFVFARPFRSGPVPTETRLRYKWNNSSHSKGWQRRSQPVITIKTLLKKAIAKTALVIL